MVLEEKRCTQEREMESFMKRLFSTEGTGLKKPDRGPTVLPSEAEGGVNTGPAGSRARSLWELSLRGF